MPNPMAQMMKMMASAGNEAAFKELAVMVARVQRHHFEELRRQGFSDSEALALVTNTHLFKNR